MKGDLKNEKNANILKGITKKELVELAAQNGKTLAGIVSEAVDNYLVARKMNSQEMLERTSGLWKDGDELDSEKYLNGLRSDMNMVDAIIAATARHPGAILYTLNTKDYPTLAINKHQFCTSKSRFQNCRRNDKKYPCLF
ncbi:MAG: hypothetical protein R6U91_09995 [Bacillota bacterium]